MKDIINILYLPNFLAGLSNFALGILLGRSETPLFNYGDRELISGLIDLAEGVLPPYVKLILGLKVYSFGSLSINISSYPFPSFFGFSTPSV